MNDQYGQLPSVYNLTTKKEKFEPDKELVERELDRLMKPTWQLPNDLGPVMMAPLERDKDEQSRLRSDLQSHIAERLKGLRLVLLMDRWMLPSEETIAENLGVYVDDIRRIWSRIKAQLQDMLPKDFHDSVVEQVDKVCNEAIEAVPTVILLMKAIERSSKRNEWKRQFKFAGRSWLTTKVLHHELGHHVFPVDASKYVLDDSSCATTMRAEAGANWYAWLIGSPWQKHWLRAFSDEQSEPYRAYRQLIEWAKSEPIVPGAFATSMALAQEWEKAAVAIFGGRPSDWKPFDDCVVKQLFDSLPPWLESTDDAWQSFLTIHRVSQAYYEAHASIKKINLSSETETP